MKENPSLLLLHGANLNELGKRDVAHYGNLTLQYIEALVATELKKFHYELIAYQSNHEGDLIDALQEHALHCSGIIINAGAFSHYSYALHDALLDTTLPAIEVHLSNIKEREVWRQHSVIAPACIFSIDGKREEGYREAVTMLINHLNIA